MEEKNERKVTKISLGTLITIILSVLIVIIAVAAVYLDNKNKVPHEKPVGNISLVIEETKTTD